MTTSRSKLVCRRARSLSTMRPARLDGFQFRIQKNSWQTSKTLKLSAWQWTSAIGREYQRGHGQDRPKALYIRARLPHATGAHVWHGVDEWFSDVGAQTQQHPLLSYASDPVISDRRRRKWTWWPPSRTCVGSRELLDGLRGLPRPASHRQLTNDDGAPRPTHNGTKTI